MFACLLACLLACHLANTVNFKLGECRALWGSPDVLHVSIVVKAGQYMKTVKAMISIVGSKCVTEEGYCWLNHSVFLFLLAMLLYALA